MLPLLQALLRSAESSRKAKIARQPEVQPEFVDQADYHAYRRHDREKPGQIQAEGKEDRIRARQAALSTAKKVNSGPDSAFGVGCKRDAKIHPPSEIAKPAT